VLKFIAKELRQEKETQGIQIGKEEVKLSLLVDDMFIHLKNPKELTQNT
jgi:hypothetical protein